MSKSVKRKISVELPKQKDLSKNRPSVFQRLGTKTKKLKLLSSSSETKTKTDVKIAKLSGSTSGLTNNSKLIDHHHRNLHDNDGLDDADQDLLEKRRAEIQKELELQSKMESSGAGGMRKQMVSKEMLRKRKRARSSSSSTSSSSDSGSSSDSSSSSSSRDSRRKMRKPKSHKRRQSSDSSTDGRGTVKKVVKVKRLCAKKSEANKKAIQARKLQIATGKLRKRSQSPTAVVVRKLPGKMVQKIQLAKSKVAASTSGGSSGSGISPEKLAKMQRIKEHQQQIIQRDMVLKERERMRLLELRDRERERERLRMKEKERMRSRSPRTMPMKSRSPRPRSRGTEVRYRTTPTRRSTPPRRSSPPQPRQLSTSQTRSGSSMVRRDRSVERTYVRKDMYDKRQDSRERERRDKERQEREAAREKERHEALARCQERQRERERLAKERARQERDEDRLKIGDRLIPRPAERALAIAAARDRSRDKDHDDRERPLSHTRSIRDRLDRDKDSLAYERNEARLYDSRARMEKDDGRPSVRDTERERQRERDYVIVNRRDELHGVGGRQPPSPYTSNRNPRDDREGPVNREFYVADSRYSDREVRGDGRRVPGQHEYGGNRVFADERHRPSDRDREWIRENVANVPNRDPDRAHLYERPNERHGLRPEYDRSDVAGHPRGNYNDHRDWNSGPAVVGGGIGAGSGSIVGNIGGGNVVGGGRIGGIPPNDRKWDGGGNWPPSERDGPDNWDGGMYNEPPEWQDHHRMIDKGLEHPPGMPPNMNRRWINWRGGIGGGGRGRGQHMPGGYGRGMPPIQDPNSIGYDDHFKRNIHPIVPPQPVGQPEFITQASRYQLINKPIEVGPVVAVVPPLINEPENVVGETNIECKIEKSELPAKESVNLEVTNAVIVTTGTAAPTVVMSPTVVNALEIIPSVANASIINTPTNNEDANVTVKIEEASTATVTESEIESIKLNVKVEPSEPLETSLTAIKPSAIAETKNNEDAEEEEQIQPDDLSEISDDADEILNQQEELQEKISDSVNVINQSDTPNVLGVNQQNTVTIPSDLSVSDKTSIPSDPVNAQLSDANAIEPIPNGQTNSMTVDIPVSDLNDTKDLIVKDLHDDLELDFEEISDGELEEEARIKGLGDALGVDWASLVAESKAAHDNQYNLNSITTAKQRWAPHRILLDVGISFEMAGEQFAKRTLLNAYEKLKQEQSLIDSNNIKSDATTTKSESPSNDLSKIKIESTMQTPSSISMSVDEQNVIMDEKLPGEPLKMKIKEEILDDDDAAAATTTNNEIEKQNIEKIKNDNDMNTLNNVSVTKMNDKDGGDVGTGNQLKLPIENELDIIMTTKLHPSACIQVANRLDIEKRKNLILNAAGPYSRALSARRDLQLRRQLCGLPIKEINSKLTTGNRTKLTTENSSANKDNGDEHVKDNNNKPSLMKNNNSNKYASMALKLFRKAIEPVV